MERLPSLAIPTAVTSTGILTRSCSAISDVGHHVAVSVFCSAAAAGWQPIVAVRSWHALSATLFLG
eukprot:2907387-Rhodomonas_salina.2